MIFDSHAHYEDARFSDCRDSVIAEILGGGEVGYIMNVGSDIRTSLASVMLSEEYEQFYAAAGIHPHECGKITDEAETVERLRRLLRRDKTMALGEIGLDYHYDFSDRESQLKWFRIQMEIARELDFPVIIHDREAHGQCMDIVREFPTVKGIFHSYSGSAEMAAELIKLGWYISFSGVVTFKNASKILDTVKSVPDDRILIETDCPYLAPVPVRGNINRSDYLKYTAEKIASVRGTDYETLCNLTLNNTLKVYRISEG